MALDVAYRDDLLIVLTDSCRSITIFDLNASSRVDEEQKGEALIVGKFTLPEYVDVERVVHSETGDYLACMGQLDGLLTVHTIFNWRCDGSAPDQEQLSLEITIDLDEDQTKSERINWIDCCQRSGNLAVSCGDSVLIYTYLNACESTHESSLSAAAGRGRHFNLSVSFKLNMWALQVCLVENLLGLTAFDHVQVLRLELKPSRSSSNASDSTYQLIGSEPSSSDASSFDMIQNRTATSVSDNNNQQAEDLELTLAANNASASAASADEPQSWAELLASSPSSDSQKPRAAATLMHDTSSNLSSYHICHPLELLGPSKESNACRVRGALANSQERHRNQLEITIMLCRQFDLDQDPVKSSQMQAVYLSGELDACSSIRCDLNANVMPDSTENNIEAQAPFLKSQHHQRLASVTCFVSTLASCFVYSLLGDKVTRTQMITFPGLCLDLRPDLLNVFLLSPFGLQVCSNGTCDRLFHYDQSSSAELNLSFVATTDRVRMTSTSRYIVLVSCALNDQCQLEFFEKPSLSSLYTRISATFSCCHSAAVRLKLLTYLHASAKLALLTKGQKDCDTELDILKASTALLSQQVAEKQRSNELVQVDDLLDRKLRALIAELISGDQQGQSAAEASKGAPSVRDQIEAALRLLEANSIVSRLRQEESFS